MIQQVCIRCGMELHTEETVWIIKCPHCNMRQGIPASNEKDKQEQYAEIQNLWRNGAFSEAIEQLDVLLQTITEDSAWYWIRMLCRYGAVYAKDEATSRYNIQCTVPWEVPVQNDADYLATLQYAAPELRAVYEAEARKLERERKKASDPDGGFDYEAHSPLENGFQYLEEEEWEQAAAQFDLALQDAPEDANAYLGKLMAALQVRREEDLLKTGSAMESTAEYAALMQHADPAFRQKILQYQQEAKYQQAVSMHETAGTVEALQEVVDLLSSITAHPEAERLKTVCKRKLREKMLECSEVLIGCRAADNLVLSGEKRENRIIVAKYYYDVDTTEEAEKAREAEQKKGLLKKNDLPILLLLVLIVGLAALLICILLFRKEKPELEPSSETRAAIHTVTTMPATEAVTTVDTAGTVNSIDAVQTELETQPQIQRELLVCGTYRYILQNGMLYQVANAGASVGDPLKLSVEQAVSDQGERLVYLQNGSVFYLNADGTDGEPFDLTEAERIFSVSSTDGQSMLAIRNTTGEISLWQYQENTGYQRQLLFYNTEEGVLSYQSAGWKNVVRIQCADQVLIGMDDQNMPVKAVPLKFYFVAETDES